MDLREPRKKPRTRLQPQSPFPISFDGFTWRIYTAHLTDLGSCIANPDEITAIHSMGFFGKASLSRSHPSFGRARYGAPPIVRNRQWNQRQEWSKQIKRLNEESYQTVDNDVDSEKNNDKGTNSKENDTHLAKEENNEPTESRENRKRRSETVSDRNHTENRLDVDEIILDSAEDDDIRTNDESPDFRHDETDGSLNPDDYDPDDVDFGNDDEDVGQKLLVLPDSDSEPEDYLRDIQPRIERASFPIRETLHLTFEETFFLLFGIGCLRVIDFNSTLLDVDSAWVYFCTRDKDFIQKYVVYHYFRSKGWVVKPGLKYGGDFLLYKQGPPFYHASYIVIVDVLNADTLTRIPEKGRREITWNSLFGLDRSAQATAKEILFAQVLWPSSVPRDTHPPTPDALSEFTVKEVLWRRWNPKQNRDIARNDEDEEDFLN